MNNKKYQKGLSTIEMLISMALLVLVISYVIPLASQAQDSSFNTQTNQEALYKARDLLEKARADANDDFNSVNPISPFSDDIYTKSLNVEQVDLFTKKVSGYISWNSNTTVSLTTLITNPDAINGGDTCGSVLSGDWSNPQKTEYEFGAEILGDTSSGFPITSIQTFNHKMYVTVNNDNGNNASTFFILDISNPAVMPVILGQVDNSPDPAGISEGLNAVAVDNGQYAYVANAYDSSPSTCIEGKTCAQLQIISISNPAVPSVVRNKKINSIAAGNKLAAARSIFYKDGLVYLGLAKATGGAEFYIIDVGAISGSPTNPIPISNYEIGDGVNSIHVKDDYAYIASPNNQELMILDVSDPYNPTLVGGFDAPNGGGNNGNGKSLNLIGDKLYFGRTLLSGEELYILNNSNPETNLPILGFKNIEDGDDGQPPAPENTSINGIIIRDYLAFLITNEEFQIWNINNPNNINSYATPLILPPGSGNLQGTSTDCEGNYIYVGSLGSNDKGYISVITGL